MKSKMSKKALFTVSLGIAIIASICLYGYYVLSQCFCLYEIFLGTIALFGKFRFVTMAIMTLTIAVFTYITFVNLFFPTSLGPIQDCKCFGDFL